MFKNVNFPISLAPMVGLSHAGLRAVLREYLPQGARTIWPTEMLNSRRLPNEPVGETAETFKAANETDLVPQLLGNDEAAIRESILRLKAWGAEAIDINMGCPVAKALRHNYGVALMGDPEYAAEVVKFAVGSSDLPVSVKLRAGHQNDRDYLLRFCEGLVREGASWITLHPRTAEQQRRGSADWSQIHWLKERIPIPVLGNGDVQTADDALRMLDETHCDGVMVGRALAARPWMLWQLGERLGFEAPSGESRRAPQTPEEEGAEYGRALRRLLKYNLQFFGEDLALRKFRFHVRTTAVWLPFGQSIVSISTKWKTVAEIDRALEQFFAQPVEMSPRTELRQ